MASANRPPSIGSYFTGVFPGQTEECPHARRFVRAVLARVPEVAGDVELVAAEFFANACLHTASGEPGGEVEVIVELRDCGAVRLEVIDAGLSDTAAEPLEPTEVDDDLPHGRGLRLVEALTSAWGRLDPAAEPECCPLDCPGPLEFPHDCDRPFAGPVVTWAEFPAAPALATAPALAAAA